MLEDLPGKSVTRIARERLCGLVFVLKVEQLLDLSEIVRIADIAAAGFAAIVSVEVIIAQKQVLIKLKQFVNSRTKRQVMGRCVLPTRWCARWRRKFRNRGGRGRG